MYFAQGFENNAKAIASRSACAPTQAQPLAADAKFAADQPADAGLVVIAAVDIKPKVGRRSRRRADRDHGGGRPDHDDRGRWPDDDHGERLGLPRSAG